jgi:hypothetical protein
MKVIIRNCEGFLFSNIIRTVYKNQIENLIELNDFLMENFS